MKQGSLECEQASSQRPITLSSLSLSVSLSLSLSLSLSRARALLNPLSTSDKHCVVGLRLTAMPGFIGKQLCPGLVFIPPDFHKYSQEASKVREVLRLYDPNFDSYVSVSLRYLFCLFPSRSCSPRG